MYGYDVFGVTAFINFKIKDWVETNVRYALKSILDVNLLVLCRVLETDTGRGGGYSLHMSPIYHWADTETDSQSHLQAVSSSSDLHVFGLWGGGRHLVKMATALTPPPPPA